MEETKKRVDGKLLLAIVMFALLALAPAVLPIFRVSLVGKYMCFAIVAVGLDVIWGYTGIMSLGHGVYFGLGAYCMAMYLKLEASGASLPDFMVWSGFDTLPGWWAPFANPGFALAMVIVVPVVVAVIVGMLTFLNRIRGVYFAIISQALAMILSVMLIGSQQYTGGSNGLTNFSTIFGASLDSPVTKLVLYYATLAILIAIFVVCSILVARRVGKIFVAIRDSENRARFTGYNTAFFKVFAYALSAAIAAIAGALYVSQVGIITPADVAVAPSIEMIVWVAIGGKGTLVGPILGALAVNWVKTFASESFPDLWNYALGLVCVLVILFLPGGLMSVGEIPARIRARRAASSGGVLGSPGAVADPSSASKEGDLA